MSDNQKVRTVIGRFFALVTGLALMAFVMPVAAQEDRWWLGTSGSALFVGDVDAYGKWAFGGSSWYEVNNEYKVVKLLTGIPEFGFNIDIYFVENGFRVTGEGRYDYTSFGIWAQDSFWGFWQGEPPEQSSYSWQSLTSPTLFIAGGYNRTKPITGTGTWTGLAVGKHKLFDKIRVGRSEVVVDFNASEVDVTITGLVFGSVAATTVNGEAQTFEVGAALSWKGLPLYDDGYFNEPRKYGVVDGLDDVFEPVIPVSGENYSDTADTIRGQFYGENGDEVTGVFSKNDIEGSFGAYRK